MIKDAAALSRRRNSRFKPWATRLGVKAPSTLPQSDRRALFYALKLLQPLIIPENPQPASYLCGCLGRATSSDANGRELVRSETLLLSWLETMSIRYLLGWQEKNRGENSWLEMASRSTWCLSNASVRMLYEYISEVPVFGCSLLRWRFARKACPIDSKYGPIDIPSIEYDFYSVIL